MVLRKYIIVLLLFFSALSGFATHIVGGEIYYDCLGSNKYYITLKLYLDCCPSCTSYDDLAGIGVYNSSGSVLQRVRFPVLTVQSVPPTLYSKCYTIPSNMCVNEIVYGDTLDLPPIPGGYTVAYQRCCRNADIINILDASQVGSTYETKIDPEQVSCNNSTRYKEIPPLQLCVGIPFVFDHSVTDPDKDSVFYEFCSPFEGADAFSPAPDVPSPPPYANVQYNAPYSGSYPIASNPVFKIDQHTGIITGIPTMVGRFVVGICANEYRNGVLLNTNKRDYQFNVTSCPKAAKAYIPPQTNFCSGLTMNFVQKSSNALTFHWDFGDPTTTSDTSNLASPSWTYSAIGSYKIRLIVNPYTQCADTAFSTIEIKELLDAYFLPPPAKCMGETNEGFNVLGTFTNAATFQWNFGSTASPSTSSEKDPGIVIYKSGGVYPVVLTVTENGCTKKYIDSIRVLQRPKASYELENPVSCELQPVHFINKSQGPLPLNNLWNFGDEHGSKEESPYHTYQNVGSYSTHLIIASPNGCKDTFGLPAAVSVYQTPTAGFDIDPKDTSVFYSEIHLKDLSKNGNVCTMFWGDGTLSDCSSGHTYTVPGTYPVMQIVENNGCFDTAHSKVRVRPDFVFWLPNAFTPGDPDGVNDIYKPTVFGVHKYQFLIFDRWGQQIFQTSDPEQGWNGCINNTLCKQDVYIYKIIFKDDVDLKTHEYIGHFTLVR